MKPANVFSRKDKLIVLGVFLLAVAAILGLGGLRGPADAPRAPKPKRPWQGEQFRGIVLQMHNNDRLGLYDDYIREIADQGANTVSLVFHAFQEDESSAHIFLDMRKIPSDQRLLELVAEAKSKGLRVIFMPVVLLARDDAKGWRGTINPDGGKSWDRWWEGYGDYILHYAKLAETGGVDVFIVGSELISAEKYVRRWGDLIAKVRGVYKGRLSYSGNWDAYKRVKFWGDLDIIGMQTYHDLTGGKKPTLDRMTGRWAEIKAGILDWRERNYPNTRIMFTEVGFPNLETAAQFPWNYTLSGGDADPRQQADCFEAFFRTWIAEPAVAGIIVWEWQNDPDYLLKFPERRPKTAGELRVDKSYVPKGKPAMDVIRKYFQRPGGRLTPKTRMAKPE